MKWNPYTMAELKDAEEVPFEESSQNFNSPLPDSSPHPSPSPIINEKDEDTPSVDQNIPIASQSSSQDSTSMAKSIPLSSQNLNEPEVINGNAAVFASESHETQSSSNISSENLTNLSSESSPLPHSSPEEKPPTLPETPNESLPTTDSTSMSSEFTAVSSNDPAPFSAEVSKEVEVLAENATTFSSKSCSHPETISSEVLSVQSHNHLEERTSVFPVEIQSSNGEPGPEEIKKTERKQTTEPNKHQVEIGSIQKETTEPVNASRNMKEANVYRGLVDTTAPFKTVKEAVSKFGGIVDWKAHRAQALERRKQAQQELVKVRGEMPNYKMQSEAAENAKSQVLLELDNTKRLIEELKLNLEKAQTEEAQAKQDSELAQLRAKEIEQGIADEASVAAKAQLEVANKRHEAAVSELKSVKSELENLQNEYASLIIQRDIAVRKAEEADLVRRESEKIVEELTLELIGTKESLEYAHAAHLEAEEHRIGAALARDQDYLSWENELKQAEEELQKFNEQLLSTKDLKEKLDSASTRLLGLSSELAAYMESKLHQESRSTDEGNTPNELEELKITIEKVKSEVNILKVAEESLKFELESEKSGLANMRQMEGMASIAVSALEAEIERTKEEIRSALAKEKEARTKIVELPKLLQKAAQEADLAKADAETAKDELRKAKEGAEQAKAMENMVVIRLNATLKEIEATKASEKLALLAVKALQESEGEDVNGGVILRIQEYYMLSKSAHEAEELSNELVTAANSQIDVAKEAELKALERLEDAYRELCEKKEALRFALERDEKAKEAKLGVEQELRKWRAENAQRRRASNVAQNSNNPPKSPVTNLDKEQKSFVKEADIVYPAPNAKIHMGKTKVEIDVPDIVYPAPNSKIHTGKTKVEIDVPKTKAGKKKKSFFPRLLMLLLARKRLKL